MPSQIKVWIPEEQTWTDWKAFVYDKHGKIHQATGMELERALKLVMALEGWKDYPQKINFMDQISNSTISDGSTHNNLSKKQIRFLESFRETFWYVKILPEDEIKSFIEDDLTHFDYRTHEKYIKLLINQHYIHKRSKRSKKYNVVFPRENPPLSILDDILQQSSNEDQAHLIIDEMGDGLSQPIKVRRGNRK